MASKLPTKEELAQLYKDKGKEAVIWYAWRNAMRVLPVLGSLPLEEAWGKDTVKSIVEVCRVYLAYADMSKWEKIDGNDFYVEDYNDDDEVRCKAVKYAANAAAASRLIVGNAIFDTIAEANGIVEVDDDPSLYFKFRPNASDTAHTTAFFADIAYSIAWVDDAYATAYAARIDYTYIKNTQLSFKQFWFDQILWPKSFFAEEKKPKDYDLWFNSLLKNINQLGLDFLANDLKQLFEIHGNPQPTPKHWQNYVKDISDAELNDPDALRAIILGESAEINAVRILLLGSGGAGKSTLADRLLNKPVELQKSATTGINFLQNKPLNLASDGAFSKQNIP